MARRHRADFASAFTRRRQVSLLDLSSFSLARSAAARLVNGNRALRRTAARRRMFAACVRARASAQMRSKLATPLCCSYAMAAVAGGAACRWRDESDAPKTVKRRICAPAFAASSAKCITRNYCRQRCRARAYTREKTSVCESKRKAENSCACCFKWLIDKSKLKLGM